MEDHIPLISVVMPTRNEGEFISKSVNSILSQTYENFEFIIIDGGSTDNTRDELTRIDDERIKIVYQDQPQGISNALNRGIALSSGQYIARMDADDTCTSDRLERQVEILNENQRIHIVASWHSVIGRTGEEICRREIDPNRPFDPDSIVTLGQGFAHGSVMMRKYIIDDLDGYRTEFDTAEDYDLWLRIAERYGGDSFYIIDDELYHHRITADKLSRRKKQRLASHYAEKALEAIRSGQSEPINQLRELTETINTEDFSGRERESIYEYLVGNEYLRSENRRGACKHFAKSLLKDPTNIRSIYKLGLSQFSRPTRNKIQQTIQNLINNYTSLRARFS